MTHLFGVRSAVIADLCCIHVDLSKVPQKYTDQAAKIAPIVLNGKITDLHKSRISSLRVDRDYAGEVILKTNLNAYGSPERWHRMASGFRVLPVVRKGYPVFPSARAVPEPLWQSSDFIVERYVREDNSLEGEYSVHSLFCSGADVSAIRFVSTSKNAKATGSLRIEPAEVTRELLQVRKERNLDFGKLDYLIEDGKTHLIDVNKTPGKLPIDKGPRHQREQVRARLEHRTAGLLDALEGRWTPF